MYVPVKGGERAIHRAHELLAERRRGDAELPQLEARQASQQLARLASRVMAEGSLYDPELAGQAITQSWGDALEAVTLMRTFRTTLPRFGYTEPVDTAAMTPSRRISATFKDLPGGQLLGATFDYAHRLFDGAQASATEQLRGTQESPAHDAGAVPAGDSRAVSSRSGLRPTPRVVDLLGAQALIEGDDDGGATAGSEPPDITRAAPSYPMPRAGRLQTLARADEGFLLSLAYSTQRGFGRNHPFAGEIRSGFVEVRIYAPELGFDVAIGEIEVTECQMVSQFTGGGGVAPQFTRGYGLVFGSNERKAMSMSIVDRALRADEFGEERTAPAQDEEFVLSHCDAVAATGFVEHLKLPHYVDFQAELELLRRMHQEGDR